MPPPSASTPQNWPPSLPYLVQPLYSPLLAPSHFLSLRTPEPDLPVIPKSHKPGPSPNVLILPITDPNHPANSQHGLFAARGLAPGELIVPYIGEIHPGDVDALGEEGRRHEESDYDLWVDREGDLAVDAAEAGNEGRFVNDYRGVPLPLVALGGGGRGGGKRDGRSKGDWKNGGGTRKKPNAEFRSVWDERRGEKGMGVFVLRAGKRATGREREVGIRKGEEILVSYGKGFWGGRRDEEEVEG
ncbi:hypothetical protein OQA88_9626 [Cercophora sp. LCS_1]